MGETLLAHLIEPRDNSLAVFQEQAVEVDAEAYRRFSNMIAPHATAVSGARSAINLFPKILELALLNLRELVNQSGGIEPAIAIVQKAYNDYVAPIDIPTIPNIVEPMFDKAISYALGVMIRSAWDRIKDVPVPSPTPAPAPTHIHSPTPAGSSPPTAGSAGPQ